MNELQMMAAAFAAERWEPLVFADVTDDDSDKTFVVPDGQRWYVTAIEVQLVTTADVGNRQLEILITTAGDSVVARAVAGAVQAASATVIYTHGIDRPTRETAVVAGQLVGPLPGLILKEGMKVRVYDSAAVAPAADDMHVAINGLKWAEKPRV